MSAMTTFASAASVGPKGGYDEAFWSGRSRGTRDCSRGAGFGAAGAEGRLDADRHSLHLPRHQDQHHPGHHGRSRHGDRQGRRPQRSDRADVVLGADPVADLQQDRHYRGRDVHHRAAQGSRRLLRSDLHLWRRPGRAEERHQGLCHAGRSEGRDGRRPGRHRLRRCAEEVRPVRRRQSSTTPSPTSCAT